MDENRILETIKDILRKDKMCLDEIHSRLKERGIKISHQRLAELLFENSVGAKEASTSDKEIVRVDAGVYALKNWYLTQVKIAEIKERRDKVVHKSLQISKESYDYIYDLLERFKKSQEVKEMSKSVMDYFNWPFRIPWRILRELGYRTLSETFFKSPEDIDDLVFEDFDKYFLKFGEIHFKRSYYKMTIDRLIDFLYLHREEELIQAAEEGELIVLGHLSWTNLYRQKRLIRSDWNHAKKFIKSIIFGDDERHISEVSEKDVYERLANSYPPSGFGKNIISAILMIADEKRRFGIWNNVTIDALKEIGISGISDTDYSPKKYKKINGTLWRTRDDNGFVDLVDVDMWVWWLVRYREKII
ncbi:MAG: hypothetical protein J7L07_01215 [Candidatus Odinarchaeota archaeon]|nr:hypothetical protein [Candidatus Odinarchaeota archaeon]